MRADQACQLLPSPDSGNCHGCATAFHHRFEAHPAGVRAALSTTLDQMGCRLTEDEAGALELVLAEVFNNIVEHGYADSGHGPILLSIYPEDDALLCAIGDAGSALPRCCIESRDCARPCPEDLPEGGFGWFMIRDLVHDLHYERDANRNLLVFRLPVKAKG